MGRPWSEGAKSEDDDDERERVMHNGGGLHRGVLFTFLIFLRKQIYIYDNPFLLKDCYCVWASDINLTPKVLRSDLFCGR